jgi:hypothetical protein
LDLVESTTGVLVVVIVISITSVGLRVTKLTSWAEFALVVLVNDLIAATVWSHNLCDTLVSLSVNNLTLWAGGALVAVLP